MKVFVLNIDGKPLMPTTPRKARILLRGGHAVESGYHPFTIRLTRPNGNCVQPVTIGIDPGYKHIGFSASTKKEELYAGEVKLRTDIPEKLATRLEWRRSRRQRLRYRKSRFDNRRRPDGWLAPSVRARVNAHTNLVGKIRSFLPVSKIVLEVATFDIQKIKNPDISGVGYQQGEQLGFFNVREYVLWRDGYKCKHCHGKFGDKILNVHHIESRKTGGNAPNNLVTLCKTCHTKLHRGEISLDAKRARSFRAETFMGVLREALWKKLIGLGIQIERTYGYLTKNTRIRSGIEKSHCNDAFCIAGNMTAKPLARIIHFRQVRKRGRQVHKANLAKGNKKLAKKTNYMVCGFCRYDRVLYNGIKCFIWGLRKSGCFLLRTLTGEKIGEVSWKKLQLLERGKTWLSEIAERRFLIGLKPGVPTPK